MPMKIATNPSLLARLESAARQPATRTQMRTQRISFIYGNLPDTSTVTHEEIRRKLDQVDA